MKGKCNMNNEINDKKRKLMTIVGVLLLVVSIVGISLAMFSANFTGTKENKLKTGSISLNCTETNFTLTNTQALTDAQGIALTNNEATCTLTSAINGTINIGYDVALYDVTGSGTLTENNVKMQASKTENSTTTYLAGSSATTGVLVSSIKNQVGQYDTSITNYKLDSATVNQTKTITYKIKAWVGSQGSGSGTLTPTNTNGYCSDQKYTTKETCESAREIWGYDQKVGQAGGNFSFKLKVGATQVLS